MAETTVNLSEALAVAAEMQRGTVSTAAGQRNIISLNPVALTAAWRQAGQIIELLARAAGEGDTRP